MVGSADDRAERVADRVADRGMAALRDGAGHDGGEGHWSPTAAAGSSRIRRSTIARSRTSAGSIGAAGGETDATLSTEIDVARGAGGRNMEPGVQADVQRAIGHDVSDVKIHTDGRADRVAGRIQASAFTVGRDIFFGRGQYQPETTGGMHTLLHESAHAMDAGPRVQRMVRRRTLSVTTEEFDGTFKKGTGVTGAMKSLSSDEIPKIREALKAYHGRPEGDPKRMAALQTLIKLTDSWLKKHAAPKSRDETSRVDIVDSIRTQVSIEYAKTQAESIYMQAGRAAVNGGQDGAAKSAVKPLANLSHQDGFAKQDMYDERADVSKGRNHSARSARKGNGLAPVDPRTEDALSAAMQTLSPAEFAAINTYTGNDYSYINPNIGGWGRGPMDKSVDVKFPNGKVKSYEGTTDDATAQQNRSKYEEAALHAGFMAEAFRKLPVWKGNTYRGMVMSVDFLGLTTKSRYKANDYWSTSEAISVSRRFLKTAAGQAKTPPTMAALCTVQVTNGRDVGRMSNAPDELEILLPPGSIYKIGKRRCLTRGVDDDEIKAQFTAGFFDSWPEVTQFWLIDISQQFSDDKDVVGAYQRAATWKEGDTNKTVANFNAPWIGLGGSRIRNAGPGK
jgi:Domain of unknown function (DUF4157)/ADP-ribosyltransferase exoenzyme